MAVGDIYQVKSFVAMFGGELALNSYWFRETGLGLGNATNLALLFELFVQNVLAPCLPQNTIAFQTQVLNTHDFSDNAVVAYNPGYAGTASAQRDLTAALAFRKREGGIGSRYSYKRYPAPENYAITGWTDSPIGFYTKLEVLSAALGTPLGGIDEQYIPIQVKGGWTMTCTPANPEYCGQGAVLENGTLLGDWQFDRYPSHQDTRDIHSWVFTLQ